MPHIPIHPPPPLGGVCAKTFLRRHWQKRPLLIRQAIPGFASPLSPEELAGLACGEDVESRLVLESGGTHPWQLRHGPFDEDDFAGLPPTHWTLLVQEVNKHVPAAARLLERFRFIADWRIDDVMVSFAPAGGSVGPHVDSYDVFLLQGQGRRRWSIVTGDFDPGLVAGTQLKVLAHFQPDQEWVLEPGDMLYLPPGIPHHGVALEQCQTWSIGFRAPSHGDLLAAMSAYVERHAELDACYCDPDLAPRGGPGEISEPALERAREIVETLVRGADEAVWFGRLVTENRSGLGPEPPEEALDGADLARRLGGGAILCPSDYSRFAFVMRKHAGPLLFVDGQDYALDPLTAFLAPLLGNRRHLSAADLGSRLGQPRVLDFVAGLYNQGCVYLDG